MPTFSPWTRSTSATASSSPGRGRRAGADRPRHAVQFWRHFSPLRRSRAGDGSVGQSPPNFSFVRPRARPSSSTTSVRVSTSQGAARGWRSRPSGADAPMTKAAARRLHTHEGGQKKHEQAELAEQRTPQADRPAVRPAHDPEPGAPVGRGAPVTPFRHAPDQPTDSQRGHDQHRASAAASWPGRPARPAWRPARCPEASPLSGA